VISLPPGSFITPETRTPVQYFSLALGSRFFSHSPEIYQNLLRKAVEKRMMKDDAKKIGAFLSGGIDSSAVVALASEFTKDLYTFTVGLEGSSDVEFARKVTKHLNISQNHHIASYTKEDAVALFETIVCSVESYNPTIVYESTLLHIVSELAKKHDVEILLSGAGADEALAGYAMFGFDGNESRTRDSQIKLFDNLAITELRMLDLMTMAHEVEARDPFLDIDLVNYTLNLHPESLANAETKTRKIILKESVRGLLPDEVIDRAKVPMYDGAGMKSFIPYIESLVSDQDLKEMQEQFPEAKIFDKSCCYFFKIFREKFSEATLRHPNLHYYFGTYPGADVATSAEGGSGEECISKAREHIMSSGSQWDMVNIMSKREEKIECN